MPNAVSRRADRPSTDDHVCTKKCLRKQWDFGRWWYWCALVKPIKIDVAKLHRNQRRLGLR